MKYIKKPLLVDVIELRKDTIEAVEHLIGVDHCKRTTNGLVIKTYKGTTRARWGDLVTKELNNEINVYPPEVFKLAYEPAFGIQWVGGTQEGDSSNE